MLFFIIKNDKISEISLYGVIKMKVRITNKDGKYAIAQKKHFLSNNEMEIIQEFININPNSASSQKFIKILNIIKEMPVEVIDGNSYYYAIAITSFTAGRSNATLEIDDNNKENLGIDALNQLLIQKKAYLEMLTHFKLRHDLNSVKKVDKSSLSLGQNNEGISFVIYSNLNQGYLNDKGNFLDLNAARMFPSEKTANDTIKSRSLTDDAIIVKIDIHLVEISERTPLLSKKAIHPDLMSKIAKIEKDKISKSLVDDKLEYIEKSKLKFLKEKYPDIFEEMNNIKDSTNEVIKKKRL